MNLLFLGGFFPPNLEKVIRSNSRGATANANNVLQLSIIKGLSLSNHKLQVITLPQIGAFPLKYKTPIIFSANFNIGDKIAGTSPGFFNLIGLKHLSRFRRAKTSLINHLKNNNESTALIIYDLHPPFLKAAEYIKNSFPNVKVCLIVPDLPGFTGEKKSWLYKCFSNLEIFLLKQSYDSVDCFVLLSLHMKSKLPIGDKPFIVIEGIFNPIDDNLVDEVINLEASKKIFYSGVLHIRNGILNLIEAFKKISNKNYELVICGDGPAQNAIIAECLLDERIKYKGQLDRAEVLKLQRGATLLVNPRTPEGEFTKYSFPSKIMEYLASGVPTLMYKLDGVPDEYYNYCYALEDTSIKALTNSIIDICEQDYEEAVAKAKKAKAFILKEKSPKIQCDRLLDMLNS